MSGPAFSLIMPYHDNPRMLERQYFEYRGRPEKILRELEMVLCDDASTEHMPNPPGDLELTVRRFRIPPPHIAWSHRVATNIAATEACGKWLLLTDMDHIVPYHTWRFLMGSTRPKLKIDVAYRFERVNADGSVYKYHPDTWLLHRSLWEQIGGYDQRYRGLYGQNAPFIERVQRAAVIEMLPVPVVRYSRDFIPDASERVLTRKSPEMRAAMAERRAQFQRDGTYFADTRGGVAYEKVEP